MWSSIRCVGAHETASASYWPTHVSPILVEVATNGLWRRWEYVCRRHHGFELMAPVGDFTDPSQASFRHGNYLTCEPYPFFHRSQLLAVAPGRLMVCHTRREAVRLLLSQCVNPSAGLRTARSLFNVFG